MRVLLLLLACLPLLPLAGATHAPPMCALAYTTVHTPAGTYYVVTDGNPFDTCVYAKVEVWQECNGIEDWQHGAQDPDC